MELKPINILMTGGGAPGAAGILKCLFQEPALNVSVCDADPSAVGRWLHADFYTIPPAHDETFIDSLLALCRHKNIHVLMPLVTRELLPLSRHAQEFESAGVKLLTSSTESLEVANNKSRLYQFLEWRGIPVPAYRVVADLPSFHSALQELGYPGSQVCFKPSEANGSRGFRIISDQINELDLLFNHKPSSVYLSAQEALRILGSGEFPELLISEYLPGEEYSVDCLAQHGEAVLVIPRLRKKMINGISVQGEINRDESIIDYCTQIIRQLGLHGNIGIQVKRSEKGQFLILEINPRVQGTISAILGAGVNLPLLAIKQELGLPIEPDELHVKWGTHFSRYWTEVFY
jgi:carbamoyl-phosphate synthase large subunit